MIYYTKALHKNQIISMNFMKYVLTDYFGIYIYGICIFIKLSVACERLIDLQRYKILECKLTFLTS